MRKPTCNMKVFDPRIFPLILLHYHTGKFSQSRDVISLCCCEELRHLGRLSKNVKDRMTNFSELRRVLSRQCLLHGI